MTSSDVHRTAVAPAILAVATAAVALATWLVLAHRPVWAGVATAAAGALSVAGGYLVRAGGTARERVMDSVVDRLLDGAVFGSIAWVTRDVAPATSAGALVAMGSGFLGSYVRARGTSLGYGVEESPLVRALRYGLLALGLLADWLGWTVWAAAGVSLIAAGVRASRVAKQERA